MKYIFRILGLLFIGFGFCECSDDFNKKLVEVTSEAFSSYGGPEICSSGYTIDFDANKKFDDEHFYTQSGTVLFICTSTDGKNASCSYSSFRKASSGFLLSPFQCDVPNYNSMPKTECPTGQYADKDNKCNSNCHEITNRKDRFDCMCNEKGLGGYVSSTTENSFIIYHGSSKNITTGEVKCQNGSFNNDDIKDYFRYDGISEGELDDLASSFMRSNNYPIGDEYSQSGSGTGTGSGGGSGGEQGGGTDQGGGDPQVDVSQCEGAKSSIISSIQNYNRIYRDAGVDCSNSGATFDARDMKRSLESRISSFNSSKCADSIGAIDYTISAWSCKTDPSQPDPQEPEQQDPNPQTPQEPIKSVNYDEKTNTVTITDDKGNTKSVTPTEINKNNKGEMQTIKYTDPETGKTIEYKAKDDGTWERIEHEGQGGTGTTPSDKEPGTGTGDGRPGGSSEGEGAGTSEDGKKDGNEDGDGNFEGGELGALGDSNDFDKNGELTGLMNSNDDLDDENDGIVDSLFTDGFSILDDFTKSLDNVKEMAEDLKDNPFSSNTVVSCAIDLNLLDQSSQIDICKYTSQFKPLFSSIFFVFLNIFIGWAFFRVLMIALLNF